jgi:methionyl-tRNA formyltransferase
MRIVVLCPSLYSETSCALAIRLAKLGYIPVGALAFPALHPATLLRKLGQWGMRDAASYALAKLLPRKSNQRTVPRNPYLEPLLRSGSGVFHNLRDIGAAYGFPIVTCRNHNAATSVAQMRKWLPDLIIFTGGNILRKQVLEVPRLGVLNVHLALLPEIRGMSSPEWSLLNNVPVGITLHYMDAGIDTGPVLQRFPFPGTAPCESLEDLRNQLIAFGIDKVGEAVHALEHDAIAASPQSALDQDNQFFVMHEWLRERATERLKNRRFTVVSGRSDE